MQEIADKRMSAEIFNHRFTQGLPGFCYYPRLLKKWISFSC